jgi:hypothetical protein
VTPPPPAAGAAVPRAGVRRRRPAASGRGALIARSAALAAGTLRALPRPAIPAAVSPRRLFRGRALIAVFGVALLGLVFLQVSLLKLNTGISLNIERAAKLERDNAQARASISRLDAGRRVQDAAGQLGMVMPAAGAICFLNAHKAGRCSGGNTAEAGRGVDPVAELQAPISVLPAGQATAQPQQGAATGVTPATTTGAAPAVTTPGATAPPATQTPAAQTTMGAVTPTAQQTTPAQTTQPATTGQVQGTPAQTGGLSASTGTGG